jgi:Tfp pilus assembly protein PilF
MKTKGKYILLGILIALINIAAILVISKQSSTKGNKTLHSNLNEGEAIEVAKAMEEENPQDSKAHVMLGDYYAKNKRFAEAEKEYKIALNMDPNNNWVLKEMGNFYLNQKEYDKAEKYFKKALKSDTKVTDIAWIYHDLAHLYLAINKMDKAFENEKKALSYLPENEVIKSECNRIKLLLKLEKQ